MNNTNFLENVMQINKFLYGVIKEKYFISQRYQGIYLDALQTFEKKLWYHAKDNIKRYP